MDQLLTSLELVLKPNRSASFRLGRHPSTSTNSVVNPCAARTPSMAAGVR
jgi:hypothetical protein